MLTPARGSRLALSVTSVVLALALAACGGSKEADTTDTNTQEGEQTAQAPSTEPTAAPPKTEVVTCKVEDGSPVAEIKVTNSTETSNAFDGVTQFASGSSVLGTGEEFTEVLKPGQDQTIRMGLMEGDAPAVDTCTVTGVEVLEQ